jgi:NitT/TauT family transport system substrate-binding protein
MEKDLLKRYVKLTIGVIILICVASIIYYQLDFGSDSDLIELRVGHLLADQLHQPGWVVAEEMNYYSKEGFEVDHIEYSYGSIEMEHFAAGELDVAYVGAVPFLSARAAGVDIVAIASSNTEGSSLVVAEEIQNVQDLVGKTIGSPGIGSIQDYMLDKVMADYNVTFSVHRASVILLKEKFSMGEIDGYIAWEPHATRAVEENIRSAHLLFTSMNILEGHQCCVVAVRGDWIREKPHMVEKIVKIHNRAMKWVIENPQIVQELIANYSGLPQDLVQAAYPIVQYPYPPLVDVYSCKVMLQGQIDAGKIKSEDVLDIDEFIMEAINNSFVEKFKDENISMISFDSNFDINGLKFISRYAKIIYRFSMNNDLRESNRYEVLYL